MNIILLPQNTLSTAIIDDKTRVMHLKQVLKVTLGDTVKVGIKNGHLGTAVVSNIHDSSIELSQIHCTTPTCQTATDGYFGNSPPQSIASSIFGHDGDGRRPYYLGQ